MAWASILSLPYAILCGALPSNRLGVYMDLFNIFIVLPQLAVSTVMGAIGRTFYPDRPVLSFVVAGAFMLAAGAATLRLSALRPPATDRD